MQLTARFYGEIYHAGGVKSEVRNQMFAESTSPPAGEGMAWLYDGLRISPCGAASPGRCCVMRNMIQSAMIESFRHKGLRKFFESGSTAGVQASHAKRLRMQLAALDTARAIQDMSIPGFALHQLKGEMGGRWSISVNGNWRLTFAFHDGNAHVLDYEDYH